MFHLNKLLGKKKKSPNSQSGYWCSWWSYLGFLRPHEKSLDHPSENSYLFNITTVCIQQPFWCFVFLRPHQEGLWFFFPLIFNHYLCEGYVLVDRLLPDALPRLLALNALSRNVGIPDEAQAVHAAVITGILCPSLSCQFSKWLNDFDICIET